MEQKSRKDNEVVVIKIGSELIADEAARKKIIETIYTVFEKVNVLIVASGAVAEGRKLNKTLDKKIHSTQLKITALNNSTKNLEGSEYFQNEKLQSDLTNYKKVAFTIGNQKVISAFQEIFGDENVGEILATHEGLDEKSRKSNFLNTIKACLDNRILPVINENDAISTIEISYGDNDQLGAHTATTLLSEKIFDKVLLCLLTSANGVLATPQKTTMNNNERRRTMRQLNINKLLNFKTVKELEELINQHTWNTNEGISTGGIVSKIIAAVRAKNDGVETYVMNGKHSEDLFSILNIQQDDKIPKFVNEKQRWTHFVGNKLTDKQISLLEDYIRKHKEIKVQDWSYNR